MRSVSESLVPISELRFETAAEHYTRELPFTAPSDTFGPRSLPKRMYCCFRSWTLP